MSVRVPTRATIDNSVRLMNQLTSSLARTQEQIATGRRILTPADDPGGAAQSLVLTESISQLTQYTRNASAAEARLQREEAALDSVVGRLQRVRELVVQGMNASQTPETRAFIATEIRQNLDELVQLGNSRDGNGRYLFAGFSDESQPFTVSSTGFAYNGDQGQRLIRIGEQRFVADGDSGDAVFMRIPRGNGTFVATPAATNTGQAIVATQSVVQPGVYDGQDYTIRFTAPDAWEALDGGGATVASGSFSAGTAIEFAGISVRVDGAPAGGDEIGVTAAGYQDMFTTIDAIASALESGAAGPTALAGQASALNLGLGGLDQALDSIGTVRTKIGSRLAAIDSQVDANEGFALVAQSALSDIVDLDYTEAITRLSQQVTALEAAQQSFVRIQGMSLFDVLG